jgi:hypothetical protein
MLNSSVPMSDQRPTADPSQRGKGNWEQFSLPLDVIYEAATEWSAAMAGVERPWLCWNVSDRWCALQQRLIQEIGWTPVIGFDPRRGTPQTVLPGSIVIDFNAHFGFEIMWPHFALEFAFLFTDRLAFWHSDLLCRIEVMHKLKDLFNQLPDGSMAAVRDLGGRRNLLRFRHHRYWELVGCTTRGASRSQFDHGAGWWRGFDFHPNCVDERERGRRAKYYYDHGVGIMYWKRHYDGRVINIPREWVEEGHCTSINKKNYQWAQPNGQRNQPAEIDNNFNIKEVALSLEIAHLLPS